MYERVLYSYVHKSENRVTGNLETCIQCSIEIIMNGPDRQSRYAASSKYWEIWKRLSLRYERLTTEILLQEFTFGRSYKP